MSECTPTTEEIETLLVEALVQAAPDDVRPGQVAAEARRRWATWLAVHDAGVRASVVSEEPEGQRWFTAAYRAQNGNIIPIGGETVLAEYAQKTVDEFSREDDEGPHYFLASRILPPWLPVEQKGPNDA